MADEIVPKKKGQQTMAKSDPVVIASDQTAVPISGTVTATISGTIDANLKQVNGNTVNTGTGASGTGTQRVAVASDSTITSVGSITNALPAGANAIGKLAANSGVDIGDVDVTSLPSLIAGSAIIGKVGIDQTTPGTTNKVNIGTDGTVAVTGNVTVVQGTATNLKTQSESYQGGTAVGAANPMQVTGANGTFPVTIAATVSENIAQVNGQTVNVGTGAAGTGTQRVTTSTDSTIGTVTLNSDIRQATAANLNATVVQGTATNLKVQAENYQGGVAVGAAAPMQVSLANTAANATAVKVDGSAVTQPVSNAGLTNIDVALSTRLKPADTLAGVTAVGSITSALPSGTNNIGDVDVLTLPAVTLAAAQTLANVTTVGTITNTVPTKEVRSVTPSQSSTSVTSASTSILAANSNRLGVTIYNEGSAVCYVKLGSTASVTSYTLQVASGGYYELPFGYTGAIDGITSSGTSQLRTTEIV